MIWEDLLQSSEDCWRGVTEWPQSCWAENDFSVAFVVQRLYRISRVANDWKAQQKVWTAKRKIRTHHDEVTSFASPRRKQRRRHSNQCPPITLYCRQRSTSVLILDSGRIWLRYSGAHQTPRRARLLLASTTIDTAIIPCPALHQTPTSTIRLIRLQGVSGGSG